MPPGPALPARGRRPLPACRTLREFHREARSHDNETVGRRHGDARQRDPQVHRPWTEHHAAVRASELKVFVSTPGEYRAELTRIDLHSLWMQRGRASLPYISHAALAKARSPIFFPADAQSVPMDHTGIELSPDDIVFAASGAAHDHRVAAGSCWGSMSLSPEDLAVAGRALVGHDLAAPAATQLIRPPPHLMSRLLHLHEAAGRLAATVPESPRIRKSPGRWSRSWCA